MHVLGDLAEQLVAFMDANPDVEQRWEAFASDQIQAALQNVPRQAMTTHDPQPAEAVALLDAVREALITSGLMHRLRDYARRAYTDMRDETEADLAEGWARTVTAALQAALANQPAAGAGEAVRLAVREVYDGLIEGLRELGYPSLSSYGKHAARGAGDMLDRVIAYIERSRDEDTALANQPAAETAPPGLREAAEQAAANFLAANQPAAETAGLDMPDGGILAAIFEDTPPDIIRSALGDSGEGLAGWVVGHWPEYARLAMSGPEAGGSGS